MRSRIGRILPVAQMVRAPDCDSGGIRFPTGNQLRSSDGNEEGINGRRAERWGEG